MGGWARYCVVADHSQWYANGFVLTWRIVFLQVSRESRLGAQIWNLMPSGFCRATGSYCFQESGWLLLPVAQQITGHTDFPWNHFVKTLMWRHIMQKIPWYCKLNVLFIWLKIAAVSAWNFKFQISCFLCLETSEVLSSSFIEHSLWRGFTNQNDYYIYI